MRNEKNDSADSPHGHETLVKDIFGRPKKGADKVSALFTHAKKSPKPETPSRKEVSRGPGKPLPVAVDFGTSSIKLLQLAEGEGGFLEIIRLDRESYVPGSDSAAVRLALKRIVERNKLSGACRAALSAKDVQLYNMIFPPMSDTELVAAVNYKISQVKPFGLENDKLVTRFFKLGATGGAIQAAQQRILVLAVSRELIMKTISLLKDVNLTAVSIEAPFLCLSNLSRFKKAEAPRDEVTLWLDLGAEESFIAIERGGSLYFSRSLALTSSKMTKAVGQHCRIDEKKAKLLKEDHGLIFWSADREVPALFDSAESQKEKTEDRSKRVYFALISLLENLVVDIEHSFKYFSYQVVQSQINKFDRVVLCGGGSNLKNLDQFLSAKLGVPVERINTLGTIRFSSVVQNQKTDLMNVMANFAVCAGLSLSDKISASERINLMPEAEKDAFKSFARSMKERYVKIAVAALVLLLPLFGMQVWKAMNYKAEMRVLAKVLERAKVRFGSLQAMQLKMGRDEGELSGRRDLLKARLNLLEKGLRYPEDFSGVLATITALIPEEIWITNLGYKEGKVTIAGSTTDMGPVAKLIEDIKTAEEFIDADFSHSRKESDSDTYNFEIIARLE